MPSLRDIRYLISDIDGVLWHGRDALPGVLPFFEFLKRRGIRFVVATNNSSRPASDIVERLARLGVQLDASQVLTSAEATALYLPRIVPPGARVFVLGGEGIAQALTNAGYQLVEQNADLVVVGAAFDLTYDQLKRATLEIRRGAKFIGTNADKTFPGTEGLIPGAGSILAALIASTDVEPLVIGKPQPAMFDIAVEKMQGEPSATCMLGDRLDTDIEGARLAGLKSILVLTGVTSAETLAHSTVQPDWVFENLPALNRAWEGV